MVDQTKLDAMQCEMYNNKSYFGYKSSILKSGICKYYRRELNEKFEWCVMEMMMFDFKTKALVTNLIHRLEILLMEEVTCDEIGIIIRGVMLLEKINELHNDISKNDDNLNSNKNSQSNVSFLLKIDELNEKRCKKIALVKQFCDIITTCRKSRICNYVHCWWSNKDYDSIKEDKNKIIKLGKVLQFKKMGDSEELLKYGELLIQYIDEKNEKMFAIYNILLQCKKPEGKRFNRTDAIYLFWEIVQRKFLYKEVSLMPTNNKINKKLIFDFAINMFNRKTMKERRMFGIWIGLLMIKTSENKDWFKKYNNLNIEFNVEEYLRMRIKIEINEDFVVNDWHVNRKFGLKKFAEVGAFVVNEDISILGENGLKYRQFYIEKKTEQDAEQN